MKSKEEIYSEIKNGRMLEILDDEPYNSLFAKPQLYAMIQSAKTHCIKMKLTGLYRCSNNIKYMTFETEEAINDATEHGIEYRDTTLNEFKNTLYRI